jgi:nucleoside-diphosphate-sugar epimerase
VIEYRRVLITGATGFIGSRLAGRLVNKERASVRALVRNIEKAKGLTAIGVEVVPGDITNPDSIRTAVKGCDIIVHCAGIVHDFQATPELIYRVNVSGTRNILEAAAEAGVKRFVHLSSIAIYGVSPSKNTDETHPPKLCGDSYCDSKLEAERLVLSLSKEKQLSVVIIRPANVYGPGSPFWTIGLLEMIKAGHVQLIDDGSGMSNHVYIDNLIDALMLTLRNDAAAGEAFIISDGVNTPWKVFLGHYARMLGCEPLPSMSKSRAWLTGLVLEGASVFTGKSPALSRRAVSFWTQKATYNINKARTMLGYTPQITLEDGMKTTEEWLREAGHLN